MVILCLLSQIAVDKLLGTPTDVESFVHYLGHVEEVTAMIPPAERELLTLTNLYNVAQDFQVPVPDEDMALYKTLFPQFRYLKVSNENLQGMSGIR